NNGQHLLIDSFIRAAGAPGSGELSRQLSAIVIWSLYVSCEVAAETQGSSAKLLEGLAREQIHPALQMSGNQNQYEGYCRTRRQSLSTHFQAEYLLYREHNGLRLHKHCPTVSHRRNRQTQPTRHHHAEHPDF